MRIHTLMHFVCVVEYSSMHKHYRNAPVDAEYHAGIDLTDIKRLGAPSGAVDTIVLSLADGK